MVMIEVTEYLNPPTLSQDSGITVTDCFVFVFTQHSCVSAIGHAATPPLLFIPLIPLLCLAFRWAQVQALSPNQGR